MSAQRRDSPNSGRQSKDATLCSGGRWQLAVIVRVVHVRFLPPADPFSGKSLVRRQFRVPDQHHRAFGDDLLSRKLIKRTASGQKGFKESAPVSVVKSGDPDGCVVEDLPEVGGPGFFGPAQLAQRTPASGDEFETGLLRK